ncbi:alpha/beta fold hydrolase [Aminobacter sp. AP02]|uniref:alpha/beta fold hydrolase n=1 Tax=Aminobacter sp. AP02 TaxID=2135737 RepID=UPI000D6AF261|nr:alpha/beta fold hydrolase [Aminobacter sp. AP02]PWK65843.1 alpha/beta hydrolase family protein [Aminobacter sp. AP02]
MLTIWPDLNKHCLSEAIFGPPVLVLDDNANAGGQWHGLLNCLASRYRLHTPYWDAGAGQMVQRAIASLERNDAPMHVIGCMHGAAIAMEVALLRPDLVRSLILINGAAFHLLRDGDPNDLTLFDELAALSKRIDDAVAAADSAAAMRAYVDFWHGQGTWEESSEPLTQDLAAQAARMASNLADSLARPWVLPDCARLACPTLAVMALESPVATMRVTEMIAEVIPDARLIMVPDAGHLAPLADPHILFPVIAAHLKAANQSGRVFLTRQTAQA